MTDILVDGFENGNYTNPEWTITGTTTVDTTSKLFGDYGLHLNNSTATKVLELNDGYISAVSLYFKYLNDNGCNMYFYGTYEESDLLIFSVEHRPERSIFISRSSYEGGLFGKQANYLSTTGEWGKIVFDGTDFKIFDKDGIETYSTLKSFIPFTKIVITTSDEVYIDNVTYGTTANFPPTITTITPATSITINSATCGGNIISIDGEDCTERGVCYSLVINPTTSDGKVSESGSFSTGSYTSDLSGLGAHTIYHFRSYAVNVNGTGYGSDETFMTLSPSNPEISFNVEQNNTNLNVEHNNVSLSVEQNNVEI